MHASTSVRFPSNRPLTVSLFALFLSLASSQALAEEAAPAKSEATAKPAETAPQPESKPAETVPPPPAPAPAPAPIVLEPLLPPPPPPVEWKVQSKGGFLMTSGNSQATNGTFGVNGSRKEGNNKLSLEAGVAYGRSKTLVAETQKDVATGDQVITGLHRDSVVSTNNWASKGRYDRFLSENNTTYASTQWAGDKIAGKTLFGGGQLGYSRQLWKDDLNLTVAELGYDFSYERYVQQPGKKADPVTIHSARILVGETLSLTESTGLTASVETLLNLNKENKAIDARNGKQGVSALKDIRVNAKAGITTNLWKKLSLGLSFTLKYDQNPAPRPIPAGAPAGTSYLSEYVDWAYADKVDTLTEATLIYTFF